MWICHNNAFLSIVQDLDAPDNLLVRARRPGDIETVFPNVQVVRRPGRDYLFRSSLPRAEVAAAIAQAVVSIVYPNFKNSVKNSALHLAYNQVWHVMANLQSVAPYGDDTDQAHKLEAKFLEAEGRNLPKLTGSSDEV